MSNYNKKINTWLDNKPNPDAGVNNIQIPGEAHNIIWQHRSHAPTEYELELTKHLIIAFQSGAKSITEVVSALDKQGMLLENGARFSEESFKAEMARLGS